MLEGSGIIVCFTSGTVVSAGENSLERRIILASSGHVSISVEGGPGTADEMQHATSFGRIVVPIIRTGGASAGMFGAPNVSKPDCVDEGDWHLLSNLKASTERFHQKS